MSSYYWPITTRSSSGMVLLAVLIVVVMLALGAYSFVRLMNAEARGVQSYARLVQAREAADSGVHYVVAILQDQKLHGALGRDMYDSAPVFHGQMVTDDSAGGPRQRCRFSILAPLDDDARGPSAVRYGLDDEAAKINLNTVLELAQARTKETRVWIEGEGIEITDSAKLPANPLLYLPNMTPEIADAILDWIDQDDNPREKGAESDYYLSLNPSYRARNGPLNSLDELLLAKGVTPRLLYGEDANRNGILDPNEDDGDQSYPNDNGDGALDRGWLPYMTLYSHESKSDASGLPRINLNNDDLEALYDQLAQDFDFGPEKAKFIVAYRLFGLATDPQAENGVIGLNPTGDRDNNATGTPGGKAGRTDGGKGKVGKDDSVDDEADSTVAGLDASAGAQFDIESIVDLVGISVDADLPNQKQPVRLASPFQIDPANDSLQRLLDRTCTSEKTLLNGRVNVNTASKAVLMALPGMTEDRADGIIAARSRAYGTVGDRFNAGTAWLLTSGTLSREEFKRLEPYITGHCLVFRVQVIGYFEEGGPVARIEAVIDVSGMSPRIRLWHDLSPLGRGYDPQELMQTVGPSNQSSSR